MDRASTDFSQPESLPFLFFMISSFGVMGKSSCYSLAFVAKKDLPHLEGGGSSKLLASTFGLNELNCNSLG
jgi:hypothetical protein